MQIEILEAAKNADRIILAFSGGKDSLVCLLLLIELGFKDKMELWHHLVDGKNNFFVDWNCTEAYVSAIAAYFDIPLYYSYREGGFLREMLRDNQATAPVYFQDENYQWQSTGGQGKPNTRLMFPFASGDLRIRWCSSYLKISVMDSAIRNQDRFNFSRTLIITGDRAEESPNRAKYKTFEPHRSDARSGKKYRWVDHARPIHSWTTEEVWAKIAEHKITAHPAYYLGFGRTSCAFCIFLGKDDLHAIRKVYGDRFEQIAALEKRFGKTIAYDAQLSKKGLSQLTISERADLGTSRKLDPDWLDQARSNVWFKPIKSDPWEAPIGMFGDLKGGSS